MNLLSNGVKFTDIEGAIMIRVKKLSKLELLEDSDSLLISVIDNGLGIKKKNKEKIFTMFGSIKSKKRQLNVKGVGLGLVISKMIVTHFGGHIDFMSKYREGSTFFFTFGLENEQDLRKKKII